MEDPMNVAEVFRSQTPSAGEPPFAEFAAPGREQDIIAATQSDRCILVSGAPSQASTLALRIHNMSGWRWGPFVAVDCGGSEAVLERQLFDLLRVRPSREAHAEPRPRIMQAGTVFLYEVGKLGLSLQIRLREVLEASAAVERAGRLRQRIMASTSEPLLRRVLDGTFDEELFCRLTAIRLAVSAERHLR
jgi:DNA-binding NtrC family response regulator